MVRTIGTGRYHCPNVLYSSIEIHILFLDRGRCGRQAPELMVRERVEPCKIYYVNSQEAKFLRGEIR